MSLDNVLNLKIYFLNLAFLYLLHNKVNKKLRDQGLNDKKDPTFSEVKERVQYKQEKQKASKSVDGIEFIYVIAFHYKNTTILGKSLKYRRFFKLLADVFPIVQVRSCLKKLIRMLGEKVFLYL